jgi:L,D-peptidoglycan transpeptidase YkuD (ErfK/YbiS/YcfS/YnhG family)
MARENASVTFTPPSRRAISSRAGTLSLGTLSLGLAVALGIGFSPAGGSAVAGASPTAAASAAAPVHRQVVVVSAPSRTATVGTLEGWAWRDGQWRRVLGPFRAYLGGSGIGAASEYIDRTPRGVYRLSEAFGWSADPGTRLPYRKVGWSAWWVSDVTSSDYNTMQFCRPGTCPFGAAEHLRAISLYRHAIVIDYNRDPVVPGAGSAFFIHASAGEATQGCVAIDESALVAVLRWLRPSARPVVSIAVGDAAWGAAGLPS